MNTKKTAKKDQLDELNATQRTRMASLFPNEKERDFQKMTPTLALLTAKKHMDNKKTQENQLDEISPAQKEKLEKLKEIGQKMKDVNNIFITGQKMKDDVLVAAARQKLAQLAKIKHDIETQVEETVEIDGIKAKPVAGPGATSQLDVNESHAGERGPEEAGGSDAYYHRSRSPNKTIDGEKIKLTDPAEIAAYNKGYDDMYEGPRGGKQYSGPQYRGPRTQRDVNENINEVKSGTIKNHAWIGKEVKTPDGVGTVEEVERKPTFSQMVPFVTIVWVRFPGEKYAKEYRKNMVRPIKVKTPAEPVTEDNEGVDTIEMDVELFIRCLEWAKESAPDDIALHKFTENVVAKNGILTMDDYESLVPQGAPVEEGMGDIVKGIKRAVKGKESPEDVQRRYFDKSMDALYGGNKKEQSRASKNYLRVAKVTSPKIVKDVKENEWKDEGKDPVYEDLYKKIKYVLGHSGIEGSWKSLWRISKGSRTAAIKIIKDYAPKWFATADNDIFSAAFDNVLADMVGDGLEIEWLTEDNIEEGILGKKESKKLVGTYSKKYYQDKKKDLDDKKEVKNIKEDIYKLSDYAGEKRSGAKAFKAGKKLSDNPHKKNASGHNDWAWGYTTAKRQGLKEDASAGGTSSASVATVVSGTPGIIKRTGSTKKKGNYKNSVTPKTFSAISKGIYEASSFSGKDDKNEI